MIKLCSFFSEKVGLKERGIGRKIQVIPQRKMELHVNRWMLSLKPL
jgi:hypothetical protein